MEQPTPRSRLFVFVVAGVAFILGFGCGIGAMVIVASSLRLRTWSEVRQSETQRIRADISFIKEALDSYAMNNGGEYPSSLTALVTPDMNGYRYLKQATVPRDPWNEEYCYERPRSGQPRPRVYTLGRDKSIGGTGLDADIDYESILEGR